MQVVSPSERAGNLDAASQDTQLRAGLVALTTGLALAALLCRSGAPSVYRAIVFLPFFVASYGVLAALYATCGISAIAGRRFTCQGSERIADRGELSAHRAKGVKVLSMSLLLAAAATALFVTAS
ncbi:MAG: hypothetical protein K0S65_4797 [Labilithrix sp.]|nr:hypothetical protein [Labilithrix sp.]